MWVLLIFMDEGLDWEIHESLDAALESQEYLKGVPTRVVSDEVIEDICADIKNYR